MRQFTKNQLQDNDFHQNIRVFRLRIVIRKTSFSVKMISILFSNQQVHLLSVLHEIEPISVV